MSDNKKPRVAVYCRVGNKGQLSDAATEPVSERKKKLEEYCKTIGYDHVDGKLVVNTNEAGIIKSVFEKVKEYTENPPKALVNSVIEIALENGEVISYEDAMQRVSYSDILAFISNELNVEFNEYLNMFKFDRYVGSYQQCDADTGCEPIVPKEMWDRVQNKLSESNQEFRDCRGVSGGVSMYEMMSFLEGYDDITFAAMELVLEKGVDALMYQLNYDDIERVKEFPVIYKRAIELGILTETE